jgi:hypothetical protein
MVNMGFSNCSSGSSHSHWDKSSFLTNPNDCGVYVSMTNLIKVPVHKSQSCFMMCVTEPDSETKLVVLGINAPLLLHFMLIMQTCSFAVQVKAAIFLVMSPIYDQLCLVFPCSVWLQSICLTSRMEPFHIYVITVAFGIHGQEQQWWQSQTSLFPHSPFVK